MIETKAKAEPADKNVFKIKLPWGNGLLIERFCFRNNLCLAYPKRRGGGNDNQSAESFDID